MSEDLPSELRVLEHRYRSLENARAAVRAELRALQDTPGADPKALEDAETRLRVLEARARSLVARMDDLEERITI
jgi:predicted  nucleic acid-binding Zn-ribbon protein